MTKSVNQLVDFFVPEHYDLTLDIDRVGRAFRGAVRIEGERVGAEIRLHAKDLKISRAAVDGVEAKVKKHANDEISLQAPSLQERSLQEPFLQGAKDDARKCVEDSLLRKRKVEIEIEFVGKIVDGSMHGMYPCNYELEGEKREWLATQFESHHAREVFPCVDEPAAKATFDLALIAESGVEVLSNMPISLQAPSLQKKVPSRALQEPFLQSLQRLQGRSLQKSPQKTKTTFETTPRMSTYLLAFVIGDMQRLSAKTKRGVEVNIFATPAQKPENLKFAANVATRCIDFYEEYFGARYPLPKSDHVALPDFSSGAMENWGLITYRETALLADRNAAVASKQYIATVIAHELSHQWFGNLVTMRWWDDLWLNESFASLCEHIATDALFPDWQMWQTFETGDVVAALRRDALPGVQAVRSKVRHPDEISTLFDSAIVYAKGERLLKMCRALVGEKSFRAGLKKYFKKFAYQNTEANDLWACLDEVWKGGGSANTQSILKLMTPWLTRPGYPVVSADFKNGEIILTQERFLSDGTTDGTIWPIPLFSNDENCPRILEGKTVRFRPKNPDQFRLNVGNNAHFIYVFSENLREKLTIDIHDFSPIDRAATINQILLLARGGRENTADLIEVLSKLRDENSDAVWDMMNMALGDLMRFVEPDSDDEKRLKKLAGELAREQYLRLGWEQKKDESAGDTKLRATIISRMIYAEDHAAIDRALKIYSAKKHKLTEIAGDLRPIILGAAVRHGGREEFAYLLDIYKSTADAELKQDICAALTSTHDQSQIDEIVGFLDRVDIVRPQDVFTWYAYMLGNRRARPKIWGWVRASWPWIIQTFSGDKSYDLFPRYAGQRLQTRAELAEFDEFFTPLKSEPALTRAIDVGHGDIAARVEWLERDRDAVLEKLKSMEGE
ncbi:M1 family metallopeptidase [Candidatus Saccharibacteria bacterium]|nr:M1 family metallopeptidase [Candidatus Saccharibacteria bacterium]